MTPRPLGHRRTRLKAREVEVSGARCFHNEMEVKHWEFHFGLGRR